MVPCSEPHAIEVRPRLPSTVAAVGPVAAGGALHANRLADSGQSVVTSPPAPQGTAPDRLATGRANDAGSIQPPSQRSVHERDVGILGPSSSPTDQQVHSAGAADVQLTGLQPGQLLTLLNSTPLGTVTTDRQLLRYRQHAGFRGPLSVIKLTAWLAQERHKGAPASAAAGAFDARMQRSKRIGSERVPSLDQILGLLEQQQYRCALTGQPLTPETASLDHMLPVCRNGPHTISNAQIVLKEVNRAKGTLTNEEFITLCRAVVAHADRKHSSRT